MGRNTYSDVGYNVLWIGEWDFYRDRMNHLYNNLTSDEWGIGNTDSLFGHGWYITGEAGESGKNKRLLSTWLSKEINGRVYHVHHVHLVNNAEYDGQYWHSIHSDETDSTSVRTFQADFGFDEIEIEDMDSIQQTL